MTFPASGNNEQHFNVLIDFAANQEVFERVEKATAHITDDMERVKEMTRLYAEELKKANPELFKQIEAEKQAAEAAEKLAASMKKQKEETSLQIRNLRAQAREITTSVRLLNDAAADIDRFAKPLALFGTATVGGIFAFAQKYVNDAKTATETTREWKAAQDDLNRSGERIGEVLATEALPLIKEAATVTRQIAGFLEAHPEAVKLALGAGGIALAVGTIGKAVSSGIRLYADLKLDAALTLQNTAAQLQLKASENQLRAAGIQAEASATPTPGGGGGSSTALLAGVIPLAAVGTFKLFQEAIALSVKSGERFQQALVNMGLVSESMSEKLTAARNSAYEFAKSIPVIGSLFAKAGDDIQSTVQKVQQAVPTGRSFLGGSQENQDAAVQAFEDWKRDDARIVQDAMDQRRQIIADGEKAIVDITRNYVSEINSISARFNAEAAQITERFQQESQKAEQDYQKQRAEIVQSGNERIHEIQEDEQKKREEIERQFAKAAAEAGADRDALALVKAQEARDEALAEASQGTDEAIRKEREETQKRLQELATRYAQERLQRQQQYEQDLKENALRRAQALKEAAERHQAELKQAREANAQKLKDLDAAAQQERIRRREQLTAQLSDLGIVLNSERTLRNNAYNAMLGDLQNWLNQMGGVFTQTASSLDTASGGTASSLDTSTGSTNPNFPGLYHDVSGYAYKGIYRMAQNGLPEWVIGGQDTKTAERAIGGQLNRESVMRMFELFGAMRGASLNYSPTINNEVSARTRRDLQENFNRQVDRMLGGYG